MDNEPEMIRQRMEDTRTALADKLECLEQQVVETVQGATCAVTDTVENVKDAVKSTVQTVKDSVENTVENVKSAFDISSHVQKCPWTMFGSSIAAGFLVGRLLTRDKSSYARIDWNGDRENGHGEPSWFHRSSLASDGRPAESAPPEPIHASKPAEKGWLDDLMDNFGPEIHKLKGLAIGTTLGVVRDMVGNSLPQELSTKVTDVMDSVTSKLGGETLHQPVFGGACGVPSGVAMETSPHALGAAG